MIIPAFVSNYIEYFFNIQLPDLTSCDLLLFLDILNKDVR